MNLGNEEEVIEIPIPEKIPDAVPEGQPAKAPVEPNAPVPA